MQKRLSLHLFPAAAEEGSPEGGSPLAPAAEAASPARGGSPEGSALWRPLRRRPPRRGAGVQRAEPFGAVCGGHHPRESIL